MNKSIIIPNKKIKKSEITKKNIFNSATKLFIKKNYDEVRISDIAKDSGIDAALVMRYFKSKENLYTEIIKDAFSDDIHKFMSEWPDKNVGKYIAITLLEANTSNSKMEEIMELMYRSSSNELTSNIVYENIHIPFRKLIMEKIGGTSAELKSSLIIAYLSGISGVKKFQNDPLFNINNKDMLINLLSLSIDNCLNN